MNPGGVIEIIDIVYPVQSDDGTLTTDMPLYQWAIKLLEAFTKNGSPLDSAVKYKQQLEEAGFVDVNVVKRKWPLNRWPKDPKYKQLGMSIRSSVCECMARFEWHTCLHMRLIIQECGHMQTPWMLWQR